MSKQVFDMQEKVNEYRFEYGLQQKIPCSKQENKEYLRLVKSGQSIPAGVHRFKYENGDEANEFYTVYAPKMDQNLIMEYLTYKKLDLLRTIENCLVFFTTLTVIGLLICFFWYFLALG